LTEALGLVDPPGIEFVLGEQFEQTHLALAVLEAVAQADGLFEQFLGPGRVDRVEVDARLAA